MTKARLAILISGRGTNMEAILEACEKEEDYPATPVLVLSNRPDAEGLSTAVARGVNALAIDHKQYGQDRQAFERALDGTLRTATVDIIALAGFMRILTPWFVNRWAGRLINIHPSLLPKYTGLNTHQRAIDAGDLEHGCSVHWVSEGVDEGQVIAQAKVPIKPTDTSQTLHTRVQSAEHILYPQALKRACKSL